MTREDIERAVIEIVAETRYIETSQIGGDSRFREDLNFDSLDDVELVMELEDTFSIAISNEEAERLETVKQVVDFITNATKG